MKSIRYLVLTDIFDNGTKNFGIFPYQIKPRFARSLRRARRDDDERRVGEIGIITRVNFHRG